MTEAVVWRIKLENGGSEEGEQSSSGDRVTGAAAIAHLRGLASKPKKREVSK
jgi:hypothetical protein